MPETVSITPVSITPVSITIDGRRIAVAPGTTVAAAIAGIGSAFRQSVTGEPRAALCGMGICFECRASVNGSPHTRTCQILCQPGMEIRTR